MLEFIRLWIAIRFDKRGVTAIEYGLIAGLIAIVIITSVTLLGTNLSGLFNRIATNLTTVATK